MSLRDHPPQAEASAFRPSLQSEARVQPEGEAISMNLRDCHVVLPLEGLLAMTV